MKDAFLVMYDPMRRVHTHAGVEISDGEAAQAGGWFSALRARRRAMTTGTADPINQAELDEAARHAAIDDAVRGWQPQGDKVVLATMRPVEKKVGSIVVPGADSPLGDKVERRGRLARVVAAGPEAAIAVGTRVYCSSFAGAVVEVEGHSLLVVSESELLLVESGAPIGGMPDPFTLPASSAR